MTQAKAATVANALITAGYKVTVYLRADGEWAITVKDSSNPTAASAVSTFATGQSVSARVIEVEFV